MKALILGAGYATRLHPLTKDRPKPLLPVGGRPMVEWILDKVLALPAVDTVHLVSNHRFAGCFRDWLQARPSSGIPIVVHDDGTTTNENRLGAIGDMHFVIREAAIRDDLLVVAGDNLFEFGLEGLVSAFRAAEASTVGLLDLGGTPEEKHIPKFSVVQVDAQGRLTDFVEKPAQPKGTLVSIAIYLYARKDLPMFQAYLDAGEKPDQPGLFVQWLHKRVAVHGHILKGGWMDIGGHEEYERADRRYADKRRGE